MRDIRTGRQGTSSAASAVTDIVAEATHERPAGAPPRLIAIIGAGLSGTTVAIQLLRRVAPGSVRILLIDSRDEAGAGVAYATRDYPYPLNVAAGQMSLDPTHPHDFLEFARGQGIDATAADFLPRQVYGDYLRARLAEAHAAQPRTEFELLHARVLQLRRNVTGRFEVWLDDGRALAPDHVVLALGNAPPATPPELEPIVGTPFHVHDPWSLGHFTNRDVESVLLIGSGLTMIDAALRLAAIRPRPRHIYVLSRHGLLPQSQAGTVRPALQPDIARITSQHSSLRALVRETRVLAAEVEAGGGDWREVITRLRPQLSTLWRGLDQQQRARFLRHARAYWEVHRHRVPAAPLAAVQTLQRMGVLEVHAGHLEELRVVDGVVEVSWRPRGARRRRAWLVDRVVNCTGPDSRIERQSDPLVRSLLANGLVRADPHGLGIDVADDGRVIARDGRPVDSLWYLGPWLRARDWECTAVPELREHAARLAQLLAAEPASALA